MNWDPVLLLSLQQSQCCQWQNEYNQSWKQGKNETYQFSVFWPKAAIIFRGHDAQLRLEIGESWRCENSSLQACIHEPQPSVVRAGHTIFLSLWPCVFAHDGGYFCSGFSSMSLESHFPCSLFWAVALGHHIPFQSQLMSCDGNQSVILLLSLLRTS